MDHKKSYETSDGFKTMEQTLGKDLAKFIARSRRRGVYAVTEISEGAPTSKARLKRIQQELASTSLEISDL